jgi:hypothetical protein
MLAIASAWLFSWQLKASFSQLGFPDYFRTELAVAKFGSQDIAHQHIGIRSEVLWLCWIRYIWTDCERNESVQIQIVQSIERLTGRPCQNVNISGIHPVVAVEVRQRGIND